VKPYGGTTQHDWGPDPQHIPWNKGKLIGRKLPLKLKEIWAIRIRLQLANRIWDLALFNLAIPSSKARFVIWVSKLMTPWKWRSKQRFKVLLAAAAANSTVADRPAPAFGHIKFMTSEGPVHAYA